MSKEKYIRKEAIALSYNPEKGDAPRVVAKGKGKIAETILERAEMHAIPIQEDASLVELLGQLNLNEKIPEELYRAVSEVFAYIYHIDREHGLKKKESGLKKK